MCVNSPCLIGVTSAPKVRGTVRPPWLSCEHCLLWSHTQTSVLEFILEDKQVEEAWKGALGGGHCTCQSMVNPQDESVRVKMLGKV